MLGSLLIRLIFTVGVLGAGIIVLRSQSKMAFLYSHATAVVPGVVVERLNEFGNVDRAREGRSPAYRYKFEFQVHGRPYTFESYGTLAIVENGTPVQIRYVPEAFAGVVPEDVTWLAYAAEYPPPRLEWTRRVVGGLLTFVGGLIALSLVVSLVQIFFHRELNLAPPEW